MLVAMDLRQKVLLFFYVVTWLGSMANHMIPYWVKVDLEIERLVVSISINYIWTTLGGMPVSLLCNRDAVSR